MDAAYKSDIREINELNYARFEAKLEQRLAELTTKIEVTAADLRGEFRSSLEKGLHEQTRFFFLAWAVLLASNIALWFRGNLLRINRRGKHFARRLVPNDRRPIASIRDSSTWVVAVKRATAEAK